MIPSISFVSKCWISVRTNPISFRAFSNTIFGSVSRQRRKFGAMTIDRLLMSILVTTTFSGAANTCAFKTIKHCHLIQVTQKPDKCKNALNVRSKFLQAPSTTGTGTMYSLTLLPLSHLPKSTYYETFIKASIYQH